ncbi:MAG: TonB-dependent receptor [Candidatus Polarisedimenticolaceae bacterium]|nr:TonB-dependent receptor [Candidatus Polarisedimenticolaceae bacterium]
MIEKKRIGQLLLPMALGLVSIDAVAERLETVNVTANRIARTADQTLASVEVITREDIERSPAKNIYELVAGLPGIDVATSGGYGKADSLYVRGNKTGHLLVLVDGVRVGSATLGRAALEQFSLSQIERIEIVRGPRSHLYGSEAIGGVLQIFTKQANKKSEVNAEVSVGSHKTKETSIGFSDKIGATSVGLHINRFETDGINALDDNNPDRDGYDSLSISGSIHHQFAKVLALKLSGIQVEATNEYDSPWVKDSAIYADLKQQVLDGRLSYSPTESWDMVLVLSESRDESEAFKDGVSASLFETKRSQALLQNDLYVGESGSVTFGIELLKDEVSSSTEFQKNERVTRALFAQNQTEVGLFDFVLGARRDETKGFDGHTTGNIAVGANWNQSFRTVISYGTAYKQPTFNDLYYIDPWGAGSDGNPDLKPEKSKSREIAFIGTHGWGAWDLRAYHTIIDDLIAWEAVDPNDPWSAWRPRNVDEAEIKGLELKVTTRLVDWRLTSSFSLTDARDKESDKLLINRARESGRFDIYRSFGATSVNASWLIQGDRYGDAENKNKVKGYATVDFGLTHQLDKTWKIKAKAKNLFDKKYQTIDNYNTMGREIFLSVAYQTK